MPVSTMRFIDAPNVKKISQTRDKCEWKSRRTRGLPHHPKYLSCECAKKEKACGGGELPGTSGEIYWALMKKRQSREKKGFSLRRDQNNGEKFGLLTAPQLVFEALVYRFQAAPGCSRLGRGSVKLTGPPEKFYDSSVQRDSASHAPKYPKSPQ